MLGSGVYLGGHLRPYCKGRGPSASQFWGFPSIYAYTLCYRTTKFDLVTHTEKGLVFSVSATPPPQGGGVPALSNLGFPSIYACPLCRRNTKFDVFTCPEALGTANRMGPPRWNIVTIFPLQLTFPRVTGSIYRTMRDSRLIYICKKLTYLTTVNRKSEMLH